MGDHRVTQAVGAQANNRDELQGADAYQQGELPGHIQWAGRPSGEWTHRQILSEPHDGWKRG